MKLDRNLGLGRGKYALIKLRDGAAKFGEDVAGNEFVTVPSAIVDFGDTPDTDFFVIRLKDKYAAKALTAYACEAAGDDPEYAEEILELARRADLHPGKRKPD